MRIWDIDPGFLNDKSLLGEHRELHGLFSIHVNGKKGYARHPETLRWQAALSGLRIRHGLLVSEMRLRGFTHKSPLDGGEGKLGPDPGQQGEARTCWPGAFIDPPARQFSLLKEKYQDKPQGRIPLPKTPGQLWACHKYSVMARDPDLYRKTGPDIAAGQVDVKDLSRSLVMLLRQAPQPGRLVNALEHMWGYVSGNSRCQRKDLGPAALLREIQALARDSDYIFHSTALGELGFWVRYP